MLCNVPAKISTVAETAVHLDSGKTAEQTNAVLEIIANVKIERGSTLQISNFTDLLEVPDSFGDCRQVVNLSIDNNFNLTAIPERVEEMKLLERANFSYNRIEKFPAALVKLKFLTTLDLSNNQLRALHPEVNGMKNLEKLVLDNNLISSFPPSISYLSRLQRLSILNNPVVTEELEVKHYDEVVICPEQQEEVCMICQGKFTDGPLPCYNFTDFAGTKNLPLLYVVCGELCRKSVAELANSEMQNFSTLLYN